MAERSPSMKMPLGLERDSVRRAYSQKQHAPAWTSGAHLKDFDPADPAVKRLATKILALALEDLSGRRPLKYFPHRRFKTDQKDAREFIFGADDEMLRFWCLIAGVDVEGIRRKARRVMA